MNNYESIILCQPDDRKSCSACCGLFNFTDISRENLSGFLSDGAARSSTFISDDDSTDQGHGRDVRDRTSYICPHQGYIFSRRPGCLLHPLYRGEAMRRDSFFGEKICNGFLCPAHSLLTAVQKKTIIELIHDWYLYSISIIDPESTAWIIELLNSRYYYIFERPGVRKKILEDCLSVHAGRLARCPGPIFYYSLSEFNSAKEKFSLACDTKETIEEKREITAAIEHNL
ncbi:MAG: hypothetical protein JW807_01580 [Spirochaetes bacterium]|nr:hypothetical protein [Spirochaetota bacterium]